jgi:hypothetical protein
MTIDESDLAEEHPSSRRRWDDRTGQLLDDWHLPATAAHFGRKPSRPGGKASGSVFPSCS